MSRGAKETPYDQRECGEDVILIKNDLTWLIIYLLRLC